MNHLCFVVDNSMTMSQRGSNGMALLDYAKSAIETVMRKLGQGGYPGASDHVHLYVTSLPSQALSSFEHDQSHLECQLKNIVCAMPTSPVETLQTAVDRISSARILSQFQTLLGYRQAIPFEPALIFFLTDKMTIRKAQSLRDSVIGLRSEHQLIVLRICSPAPSEKNIQTEEVFRRSIEGQPESRLLFEFAEKCHGEMRLIFSLEGLVSAIWSAVQSFKAALVVQLQSRQLKRRLPELQPSQKGQQILGSLQKVGGIIRLQLLPLLIRWKIPIPFEASASQGQPLSVRVSSDLSYFIDWSKHYLDSGSALLPENKYRVLPASLQSIIASIECEQQGCQRYPIFSEHRGVQFLIGILSLHSRQCELSFFPANFIHLKGILKAFEAKQPLKAIEANFTVYLSTVPPFYFRFLLPYAENMRIKISMESYQSLLSSPAGTMQTRLQAKALAEQKMQTKCYQVNYEAHQKCKSECCPVYSQRFASYSQLVSTLRQPDDLVEQFCLQLIKDLLSFKQKMGLQDYLSSQMVESTPMTRELQKYNFVRRGTGEDDFNENITLDLGNPYRKKRKLSDDQRSINVSLTKNESGNNIPSVTASELEQLHNDNLVGQTLKTKQQTEKERQGESMTVSDVVQIEEQVVTNQVLLKVNRLATSKTLQLQFNPNNLRADAMMQNELVLRQFIPL